MVGETETAQKVRKITEEHLEGTERAQEIRESHDADLAILEVFPEATFLSGRPNQRQFATSLRRSLAKFYRTLDAPLASSLKFKMFRPGEEADYVTRLAFRFVICIPCVVKRWTEEETEYAIKKLKEAQASRKVA